MRRTHIARRRARVSRRRREPAGRGPERPRVLAPEDMGTSGNEAIKMPLRAGKAPCGRRANLDRSARLRRGQAPFQSREARIVAIEGDPFTAPLDGERRIPSVGDERASRIRLEAQPLEDVEVPLARLHDLTMGLPQQIVTKAKGRLDEVGFGYVRGFVVTRTTAARAKGEMPNRVSLSTTPSSHGRQTACWGTS